MLEITRLHHVAIPARDFDRMQIFYKEVLGLEAHPDKANWLCIGKAFSLHLMPSREEPSPARMAQHLAIEVASLPALVATLLSHGLEPYQSSPGDGLRPITDVNQPLDFGLGTVFVEDPEHNLLEFVQRGKGIYATLTHDVS